MACPGCASRGAITAHYDTCRGGPRVFFAPFNLRCHRCGEKTSSYVYIDGALTFECHRCNRLQVL